ncbi:hypothetical protein GZ22_18460 (plasmid) [Terribacillus saccharophilus]|uniref:Uncharacterized protein n=1 Tax=Terribacillus saccharophilus TaxID=361277 RepID=A0A075LQY9_9BACI|nr:hypothetical protein GZ22_18460 [Terribacillus goriensis]
MLSYAPLAYLALPFYLYETPSFRLSKAFSYNEKKKERETYTTPKDKDVTTSYILVRLPGFDAQEVGCKRISEAI